MRQGAGQTRWVTSNCQDTRNHTEQRDKKTNNLENEKKKPDPGHRRNHARQNTRGKQKGGKLTKNKNRSKNISLKKKHGKPETASRF